ncbi:MAG: chorismate synthase [Eggerthellaceae bacterium]|jgi:chorismate synthase|nr:chorismate synthase [Eggerthellaceae bacterium]MCH4220415.1 chorismate synthase [Eggerthellaceae bacterium]
MHYVTAGESHGPCLTAIVSDVPAGLRVSEKDIDADLQRRQSGYGRGGRQRIESDHARVLSGLRFGVTLGTPISIQVVNADWRNWQDRMAAFGSRPDDLVREVTPRPGHADLVGALKNNTDDCRDVLERASARETAARVAAAGIAREFLADLGVDIRSYVTRIGSAAYHEENPMMQAPDYSPLDIEMSDVRCPDAAASDAMRKAIDAARDQGESLGGTFRVVVTGLVEGLGDFDAGPNRLTGQLASAVFSIPAIKGVEFGLGFAAAARGGSEVHDPITRTDKDGFSRATNNAGGLEGGMSTGMPLIITAAMKPIPTLAHPLATINMDTMEPAEASRERSDVCAVPACAVVAEAEVAFVIAEAYMRKFGHDNMVDIKSALQDYRLRIHTQSR